MGLEANIQGSEDFDRLEIVKTGITSVSSDGSPQNWTTVAHNLGFRPLIKAVLNNVSVGAIADAADVPLPTYAALTINVSDEVVEFNEWVHAMTDTENSYFVLFNATGGYLT